MGSMIKSLFAFVIAIFGIGVSLSARAELCGGAPTTANLMVSAYTSWPSVNNLKDGVDVTSEVELRQALAGALVGAYRSTHGIDSLPVGNAVVIGYLDGSGECMMIGPASAPFVVTPILGTQTSASGGSTSGGGAAGAEGGSTTYNYSWDWYVYTYICDDYFSNGEYTGTICELLVHQA